MGLFRLFNLESYADWSSNGCEQYSPVPILKGRVHNWLRDSISGRTEEQVVRPIGREENCLAGISGFSHVSPVLYAGRPVRY